MAQALTIAIDGPAAGGKGTIAVRLAEKLGYMYVDTGAMYRAVAWIALQRGLDLEDETATGTLARTLDIIFRREERAGQVYYRVLVDGQDVSIEIRRPEVDQGSSIVAQHPAVREALVEKQRDLARSGGIVMEGRDITTVVLPQADIKLFITASLAERARRRYEQRREADPTVTLADIEAELAERDRRDSERKAAPMRIPSDAVVIDTTNLDIETSVEMILRLIGSRFSVARQPG